MTGQLQRPLRIGLTGGIASGKSAAADFFSARGVPVIDTDTVAREVVEPGQPGLAAVVAAFGRDVLTDEGRLDRGRLRRLVFADADRRRTLESILHPLIRAATFAHAERQQGPYQIFAVPLLAETGFDELVDRVLVIDCPPDVQLQRLMQRDGESEAAARQIIASQASRAGRLAVADDIIVNDGSLADLEAAVEALHQRYLGLAAPSPRR